MMTFDATQVHQSLKGKVAIVTGGSRGIGAGVALELAKRGAKVAIVYTSPNSGKLADDIISQVNTFRNGSEAIKIQADLRQVDAPEKIVQPTLSAFGPSIDVLVNNAGVLHPQPILEVTLEDFASIFDVNVRGAYLLTKAVVPHLRAPGRVINVSSVAGRYGFKNTSVYSASKAALEGMTRSLAKELGMTGHTINAVAPGPVESEMLDEIAEEIITMQKNETAVENRVATVDDIAAIVAWLAEEQSRWVSGQTISASGGFLTI